MSALSEDSGALSPVSMVLGSALPAHATHATVRKVTRLLRSSCCCSSTGKVEVDGAGSTGTTTKVRSVGSEGAGMEVTDIKVKVLKLGNCGMQLEGSFLSCGASTRQLLDFIFF